MNPIEHLFTILDATRAAAPEETAEWFDGVLNRYLVESNSLEESFDLKPEPGQRSWRTVYKNAQRNEYLRTAAEYCEGENVNQRVRELRKQILRFQSIIWPRWFHLDEPPPHSSKLRAALFHAYKSGATIPTSESQLTKIIDGYYPA